MSEDKPQEQPEERDHAKWQNTIKRRMSRLHQDRTVSVEVRMLPAVREDAKALATAHGMTTQEYMESLLVNAINEKPDLLQEGRKRLKHFKGSTAAAKRYAQEEELARLRAVAPSSISGHFR